MKKGNWQRPFKCEEGTIKAAKYKAFKVEALEQILEGFTMQKRNGVLKVYNDSNNNGKLNKGDQLIAIGKVQKEFRNEIDPISDLGIGSVKQQWSQIFDPDISMLISIPYLELKNSSGEFVSRVDFLPSFYDPLEELGL